MCVLSAFCSKVLFLWLGVVLICTFISLLMSWSWAGLSFASVPWPNLPAWIPSFYLPDLCSSYSWCLLSHFLDFFWLVRFLVVVLKTLGPLHVNTKNSGPGLFWSLVPHYVTVITSQDQWTNLLQDSQYYNTTNTTASATALATTATNPKQWVKTNKNQ